MAPIQLTDNQQSTSSGCLSSIFSKFTGVQKTQTDSSNEKFVYSSVEAMEQLPPYEDIVKVIYKNIAFHSFISTHSHGSLNFLVHEET